MTEELTAPAPEYAEEVEGSRTSDWEITRILNDIGLRLEATTSHPWRVQEDPDPSRGYYISGPPETRIIAEGMTESDAKSVVSIMNMLPDALEHMQDVITLWEALEDGSINTYEEASAYLEVIDRYQKRIAQLSGDPAPIPEVSTAGDLNFMHVGLQLRSADLFTDDLNRDGVSITSVSSLPNGYVKVSAYTLGSKQYYFLPADAKVEVETDNYYSSTEPLETVEFPETPTSEDGDSEET